MSDLDTVIHQPTRLRIAMLLSGVDSADFNVLLNTLSWTNGNLSSHMSHLEKAGYVEVTKRFEGKLPKTPYSLTDLGRSRLDSYWEAIDAIRASAGTE